MVFIMLLVVQTDSKFFGARNVDKCEIIILHLDKSQHLD